MRKDINQVTALRLSAERSSLITPLRWSNVLAGLVISLFLFCALSILAIGLNANSITAAMQISSSYLDINSAHGWLIFWISASGALALFSAAFLVARASPATTPLAGITESLAVASIFLPAVVGLSYLASSLSPHYRAVSNSFDFKATNPANYADVKQAIDRQLVGLKFDRSPERMRESLMRKIASSLDERDMEIVYWYLSQKSGISLNEARRRLSPIRAEVKMGFTTAGPRSAYLTRLLSLLLFGAAVLGCASAAAGGYLGARPQSRATVAMRDPMATEEAA